MPSTRVPHHVESDADELSVEEVAARLGLPVTMLVRRIEAGDIPARRVDTADGVRYRLHLADLGARDEDDPPVRAQPRAAAVTPDDAPTTAASSGRLDRTDSNAVRATPAPPPPPAPAHGTVELSVDESGMVSPRAELAAMRIDPRELVAGLLDRWERTLEQRIHAEQRQRFQAEIDARQAQVKQLQLELDRTRAEHAAAMAERDRVLAERERELSERERWLAEARHLAEERGRRRFLFRRG